MDNSTRFDGAGVVIAWLFRAREGTDGWFTHSLVDLMRWDSQGPGHVCGAAGGFIDMQSGPRIAEARNRVVDYFAEHHPNAEWLLFLDSDMSFDCTIIEDMLKVADPKEVPILGALAFCPAGDHGGAYPAIYQEVVIKGPKEGDPDQIGMVAVKDYPENTLVKCGATGAAGLLIHRGVLAAMSRPWPDGFGTRENGTPNPYPWFSEGLVNPDGTPLGEDISFCKRARLLGIPTHVHTGIKMGHMKIYKLDDAYFRNQQVEIEAQGDRAARRRAARAKAKT
jgi:hypothetical protein